MDASSELMRFSPAPDLGEGQGDKVFGVRGSAGQPQRVSKHPVAVTAEQPGERIAVAGAGLLEQVEVGRFGVHTL